MNFVEAAKEVLKMDVDLVVSVVKWASDRNLILGSDMKCQFLKLVSEFAELAESVNSVQLEDGEFSSHDIVDAIGDCLVVTIIMKEQLFASIDGDFNLNRSELDPLKYFNPYEESLGADEALIVLGYLGDHIAKYQPREILEDIQCIQLLLATSAESLVELNLDKCLLSAYNEIKDRKGVMYDGVFVKESDERYDGIMKELSLLA